MRVMSTVGMTYANLMAGNFVLRTIDSYCGWAESMDGQLDHSSSSSYGEDERPYQSETSGASNWSPLLSFRHKETVIHGQGIIFHETMSGLCSI